MTPGALRNRRWRNGGPPFVKFGKRVRYFLPDVVKWKQQQRELK
jgi:hypothetical protein